MGSSQSLTGTQWRKSSYSGSSGGDCIECAPLDGAAWQKSTYSGNTGGDCIELAPAQCNGTVAVRDSKNPTGPTFTVTRTAFTRFVAAAASGDLPRSAR
ncbi:DUF397 domain-containing protein [Streptomyces sp. KL118A]|uniref:DUF397 domain-containing protein n=1 Tax=Streptomyces sp. KL118A TaxID=3045153 RepID=UPI00278C893D|nr:DUF397 domain-containing protein [Streptomyces sp. KL118A]